MPQEEESAIGKYQARNSGELIASFATRPLWNDFLSLCSDDYLAEVLRSMVTNARRVKEMEFDVLTHSLQARLPVADVLSSRELLCRQYVAHSDATFPTWRRLKNVLYAYPGITEEWQLFDPYNSVMEYMRRKPDQDIPKSEYPVALVFPRTFERGLTVLSQAGKEYLGFEELHTALTDAGYLTTILNAEQKGLNLSDIINRITSTKTQVVGINVTAMTVLDGLKVAEACKEIDRSIFVVMGGHHASLAIQEESVLENNTFRAVDAVVIGKGDLTFPLLTDKLRRGESLDEIPDVVLRTYPSSKRILNAWRMIPLSKYPQIRHIQLADTYPPDSQAKGGRSARMSTSEGCIGNCSFCTSPKLYDRQYNPRHVRQVVDEMEYLRDKYDVEKIYFNDDTFIKPGRDGLERANAFCDELQKRVIWIQFRPLLRTDSIPMNEEGDKVFRRLKENGMSMAFIGFESASQRMLNTMNKLTQADTYRGFIERARRESVTLQFGFIAWHPLTTVEDLTQNFQFLYEIDELYNFAVIIQRSDVFPGTRDKLTLQKRGLLPVDFNCTTDSQQYQFADPKLGILADVLNTVYRGEKRLEDFDAAISRLHLTTIPKMIRKTSELASSDPTANTREGINRLQGTYHAALKEINRTLYTFIQNHLSLYYDEDGDIPKITQDRIKKMLPNLEQLVRGVEEEIELFGATLVDSIS